MNLKEQIEIYKPFDEKEESDKEKFLNFINTYDDILTRNNTFGHFSASAFVVNKDRTKMLVVYHIINDGWVCPGGHADGEIDLLSVAVREVEEETGLKAKVLDENIFDINANYVKDHMKRGKFVSSHIHYDVIYLLEADDTLPLIYREDESKGVKWILFKDAFNDEIVECFRPIHKRLIKKLSNSKKRVIC